MTNTANIRFQPSNVAYVAVDLDTHEMTGGVMDETTGTFYPVGGGSGDFTTATMSVSNISSHEAIIGVPVVDTENNYLIVNAPVAANTNATFTVVLYKNQLIFDLYSIDDNQDITVSGDATYEAEMCIATGDFSITFDDR